MASTILKIRRGATAWLAALLVAAIGAGAAAANNLEGEALVQALRDGGYTIYFRHAATNWDQADRVRAPGDWKSCDPAKMRQLSDEGRAMARRIGAAIRALEIPVVGGREAVIRRARRVLAEPPSEGTNTVIVGHGNLMRAATGAYTGEGGSGIYAPRPEGERRFELVAELLPEAWIRLADRWGDGKD